jgi:hypothetical protein
VLEGRAQHDPSAAALVAMLTGAPMAERVQALHTFADSLRSLDPTLGATAVSFADAAGRGAIADPGDLPLPYARAVATWVRGRQGQNVDASGEALGTLPITMIDDLVDAGALTPAALPAPLFHGSHGPYLRARVAPGALSIEETYHLEFLAEYARRLYDLGDLERLTQFPVGDPNGDHYSALLRLRNNPEGGFRDGLKPEAIERLASVDRYLDALADGGPSLPDASICSDPTLWRLLRRAALKGQIVLSDEDRAAAPEFAAWRDLVEMQRCCFASDWGRLRELGRTVPDRLREEALRDEALNMAAFGELVSGNVGLAMDLIRDALGGGYTDALLVNASIIAAELGSNEAATFLAKLYEEVPDRTLASRALRRGVDLWLADDLAIEVPRPIIESVRRALQEPQDDDTLRLFLRLAEHHDGDWLCEAAVTASSDEQRQLANLHQTWAGSLSDRTTLTIVDVARLLVALNRADVVPSWASAELKRLIDLLWDAVHVDFGEAVWTAGAIELLVEGRVMNLAQDTVLSVQAGAHLAHALADDGNEISPKAEVDFLFAPVERWKVGKGELPEGLIAFVEEEVARCIGIGAMSWWLVAERNLNEFARNWDALVDRERWDHQNRTAILRAEHELLVEAEGYVERFRRYLARLNQLPVLEGTEESRRKLNAVCGDYERDLARLRATL